MKKLILVLIFSLTSCSNNFWEHQEYYTVDWITDETGFTYHNYKFKTKYLEELKVNEEAGIIGKIRGPFKPINQE